MPHTTGGTFIAFEGGEGAGKSTQIKILADRLRAQGYPLVSTREPGATAVGRQIRAILLDPTTGYLSPHAEALMFAADRAQHVATVVRPALNDGCVVLTDRYIDSSVAYQAAGRGLDPHEIAHLSQWGTGDLQPDLTILLDLDPEVGLARSTVTEFAQADRMEAESLDYHHTVRDTFLAQAAAAEGRYLVVDATQDPTRIADQIWRRVQALHAHATTRVA